VGTEKRQRQKANRQLKYEQEAKEVSRRRLTKRVLIGGGAAVLLLLFIFLLAWITGRGDDDDDATVTTVPATTAGPTTSGAPTSTVAFAYGTGECPPTTGSPTPVKTFTAAPKQCIDPAKTYTATIVTDHGNIVIALDPATAPGTVNNFVTLARYGYWNDTKIFRAAQSIDIIQGGGLTNSDPFGYTIPDEGSGWTYPPGRIAMANTGQPNSGGAQWFITTGPNSANLDSLGTYTVFGEVTAGLDVAQQIQALATSPTDDSMTADVIVERVEITES
jgi:cyclophilin family peptidyl-prolyl cis-trans isomerase